jgi:hypothetical protein
VASFSRDTFARHILGRVNPVLPPRRKRTTALRHLKAVALAARWLDNCQGEQRAADVLRWAARVELDESSRSRRECPPHFPAWGGFSPSDGVLRSVLRDAARFVLDPPVEDRDLSRRRDKSFQILYPAICRVLELDRPTEDHWSSALAEMELVDPPGSIYCIQFHGTEEEFRPFVKSLTGWPLPERGEQAGDPPHVVVDPDGRVCVTVQMVEQGPLDFELLSGIVPGEILCSTAVSWLQQPRYEGPFSGLLEAVGQPAPQRPLEFSLGRCD